MYDRRLVNMDITAIEQNTQNVKKNADLTIWGSISIAWLINGPINKPCNKPKTSAKQQRMSIHCFGIQVIPIMIAIKNTSNGRIEFIDNGKYWIWRAEPMIENTIVKDNNWYTFLKCFWTSDDLWTHMQCKNIKIYSFYLKSIWMKDIIYLLHTN